jgi:hypothetical protein
MTFPPFPPCPRCSDPYAPLGRANDGKALRYCCNTCGWVRYPDDTGGLRDAPSREQPPRTVSPPT